MTRTAPVVALVIALALAGCSPSRRKGPTFASGATGQPVVFAAIGGSETVGEGMDNPVRDAWPQVFFRSALTASATFVNFAIAGVSVATAIDGELPEVRDLHPNLVTVWLNVTDLLRGVPATTYESQLRSLVSQLKKLGALVLVANTPPVERLPAYETCLDPLHHPGTCPDGVLRPVPPPTTIAAIVSSYNAVVARVVASEGAVLVDLHGALLPSAATAALAGPDGLDPGDAAAALIAAQFAAALRHAGPIPPLHR